MASADGHSGGAGEESPAPAPPEAAAPEERPGTATESVVEERDSSAPEAEGAPAEAALPREQAEQAVQQDVEELVSTARERDEYLALAQRTQADFENYRKRAAKDVRAAEQRGVSKLARELLPALDNLARALAASEKADDGAAAAGQLAEGIRLVQAELIAALARVGIEPYSPEGERFDPQQHEAMAQQAVQGAEPGTIVEVYQPGYRLNGTVLRAAKVVVAG